MILRRTYLTTGSPQTEDERCSILQNWRNDPVVTLTDAGVQVERVRFSPSGEAFGIPSGDTDFNGEATLAEEILLSSWASIPLAYRAYADINLDGVIDAADAAAASGATMGRGVLSHVSSKIGYAGYTRDAYVTTLSHVRHRVYKSDLGRWLQRDPAGYVDGPSLYEYAMGAPQSFTDPMGLASTRESIHQARMRAAAVELAQTGRMSYSQARAMLNSGPKGKENRGGASVGLGSGQGGAGLLGATGQQTAPPTTAPAPPTRVPVRPSINPNNPPIWRDPLVHPGRGGAISKCGRLLGPAGYCVQTGVTFYCIGEAISPWFFPPIDPIPPIRWDPPDAPDPDDPCEQAKLEKKKACGAPGVPSAPYSPSGHPKNLGLPGSGQRKAYCDAINERLKNAQRCFDARQRVTGLCYGGETNPAHAYEEMRIALSITTLEDLRTTHCP